MILNSKQKIKDMTTTVKFYLSHSMFYNECLDCQELSHMHKNKFNYPFFLLFF